jgi:hypothetical protein
MITLKYYYVSEEGFCFHLHMKRKKRRGTLVWSSALDQV